MSNPFKKIWSAIRGISISVKDVMWFAEIAIGVVGQMQAWQVQLPQSGSGPDRKLQVLRWLKERIKDKLPDEQDRIVDLVSQLIESIVNFAKLR